MVTQLVPEGRLVLSVHDSLIRKNGRKIDGMGIFLDVGTGAMSTKLVTAMGRKGVVWDLRLQPPWCDEPVALPVGRWRHRKHGPTQTDLAVEMMRTVTRESARWRTLHSLHLRRP